MNERRRFVSRAALRLLAPGLVLLASCSDGSAGAPGGAGAFGAADGGGASGGSGFPAGGVPAGGASNAAGSNSSGAPGAGGEVAGGTSGIDAGAGGATGGGGDAGGDSNVAGTGGGSGAGGSGAGGSGVSGASSGGNEAEGGEAAGGAPTEQAPVEEDLAPLPADRQEHGVVAANGEVFVIGGYAPNVTSSVIAYRPSEDAWHDVADFPSPLNHPAAGVVGDKIYVAGFYAMTSLTGPASGSTFVYDPLEDEWSERAPLPAGTERAGGCVAVLGTDLYVFGGGNSSQATSFASVYDTVRDTWRELSPLPETREHCLAFESGGKIYIASGRTHTIPEFRAATLEFDPDAETYQPKQPIPTPRGGAAGALLGGRLFVFGGEGADNVPGVFTNIEAYDPTADAWEAFPPMLHPRHGFGAATLDGRIYLPGGAIQLGGAPSSENTVFYFE